MYKIYNNKKKFNILFAVYTLQSQASVLPQCSADARMGNWLWRPIDTRNLILRSDIADSHVWNLILGSDVADSLVLALPG